MTAPANIPAPMLSRSIPELVYCQGWATYPGGGLGNRSLTMDIGTPKPDRRVIAVIVNSDGNAHNITGVTLDGVAMTALVQQNGVRAPGGVWILSKPTGTTATLAWTSSAADADGQGAATLALYGARDTWPDFQQSVGSSGASISVNHTESAVLGVAWTWQDTAGTFNPPLTADLTNLYFQARLSIGHGQIFSPAVIAPGLSVAYNGLLFVAAWQS